jgi:hypothetical protein
LLLDLLGALEFEHRLTACLFRIQAVLLSLVLEHFPITAKLGIEFLFDVCLCARLRHTVVSRRSSDMSSLRSCRVSAVSSALDMAAAMPVHCSVSSFS